MKNKKSHLIVIISSIVIILVLIGLIIYGYIEGKEKLTIGIIMLNIVIVLWFGTYPVSFYTCWRIAIVEEKEYNGFVSHLIYATRGGIFFDLIFVIPLIYSPFFIVQYGKILKKDCQYYKNM